MAQIIDGKKCAQELLEQIKLNTEKLSKKPHLAVILVGENPASQVYVRSKEKRALETGFKSTVLKLKEETTKQELEKLIIELNQNDDVNAVLLQLPLPKHLNENDFISLIDPIKDVDGFHPQNLGKLITKTNPYAVACTPKGVMKLLQKYNVEIEGTRAVVVGRSNIVGKPVAQLLLNENATVTIAHSKTKNLGEITCQADILIAATGIKHIIKKNMVKQGAVVVDVGIIRDESGKLTGDVDFEEVQKIAGLITPVPGGVGPMTIACLMENTLELYKKQNG